MTVHEDPHLGASWSYDSSTRELVTFDTPAIAAQKAEFIKAQGLGGAMFWELSGDHKPETGRSLVGIVAQTMGKRDERDNHLHYPGSRFENLRMGMKGAAVS